ncbi:MAG: GH116 family glycosyl-hydrolase [Candidatus Hermodarchaeota archaeon]
MKPKGIFTLTKDKLRCSAMPLGGIGTGTIALGGDGLLKQWQITNTVNHRAFVPNSFFAVRTTVLNDSKENHIARALICTKPHENENFVPAKTVSDHRITNAMKEFFDKLPQVESIVFDGEYPFSFLKFKDSKLPIEVNLTAFNPFIPLDPKNSGLPVIIFQFSIKNISNKPIETILLGSLFNFLGWDGFKTIRGETNPLFGGNHNIHRIIDQWNAIIMTSKTLLKTDKRYGTLTIATDQQDVMVSPQWDSLEDFWSLFAEKGVLVKKDSEKLSDFGKSWTGSIAVKKKLNPNEENVFNFFLSWNFPNRQVDWHINYALIKDIKSEYWIGNRYNEWFKNSLDVIRYVKDNLQLLTDYTSKFHDVFYESSLPPEVLTSISATFSTIRTPTCFWIKDGSFHGFEGCEGASTGGISGGCCPLNCTHVWNYEFSLAHLFPTLERSMRETEFRMQHSLGYLPHRTVLPLYLPQFGEIPDQGDVPPAIDGMFGMILKIYRDYLITHDLVFLKKSWPYITKLMEFVFKEYYDDSKGIITRAQPNTYDCSIYGVNTFIGSLNLVALLACEKIASELNHFNWAKKCNEMYHLSREVIDRECWNGEYYIQRYDENNIKEFQYGIGCFSDQLIGQWWAFHLGLGYIFPPDRVKKALNSIIKNNFKDSLKGFKQSPREFALPSESGLLVCTWPYGGRPDISTYYTDEVWTGLEYELAALSIYMGDINAGLKLIRAVRERYDGSVRNPWNEVECGDHYIRPMSSWTILHALTGILYSANFSRFTLTPKINSERFKSFFITNSAWGITSRQIFSDKVNFTLSISYGSLSLKSIQLGTSEELKVSEIKSCKILLSQEDINLDAILNKNDNKIEVALSNPILLKENQVLQIYLD